MIIKFGNEYFIYQRNVYTKNEEEDHQKAKNHNIQRPVKEDKLYIACQWYLTKVSPHKTTSNPNLYIPRRER